MFLDVIDLQILDILKENSRLKLKSIASKLNLTPATIKYRIDRLVQTGIIDKFTISINIKKFGFEILALLVIYTISKTYMECIIDSLQKFSEISKISILLGDPDIIADINLCNMNALIELSKKLNQIEEIQRFKIWIIMDIIH